MSLHLRAESFRPTTFDPEARTIEAIASTGAAVARPGYTEVLDLRGADLSRLVGAPVLDGHKRDTTRDQLGVIEAARMTPEGLLVTIRFRESTPALAVMTDVANGTVRGLSIGYTVQQVKETKDGKTLVRTAVKWTPLEVSIVPVPADPGAHFRSETPMLDEQNQEGQVQTRAAQNTEIRTIANLAGLTREWADAQIDAAATPEQARAAAFAEMAQTSARTRTSAAQITADNTDPSIIATRAGEALFARIHPDHELTAQARQYAGMTIPDHARESLRRAGVPVTGLAGETLITRALHTTTDFPLILGSAVNRELRAAYEAAPAALRQVAKQTTVRDFRAKSKLMLHGAEALEPVNEAQEFKNGTIAESAESYSAKTYGKIFGMSRQMMVNDDLGAFSDLSARMGAAAAEFEAGLLVAKLTANPTMADSVAVFHANHGNLAASGALSVTTLSAARLAMRKQKDAAGNPVASTPRWLVVPPDLETTAEQLLTTINATAIADVNPFSKLSLLVEARLTNASQWYLAADAQLMDGLEYAYLEGAPGPQIETRAGFEVDGMQIKVRLDYGCGWTDYRGWYRNG